MTLIDRYRRIRRTYYRRVELGIAGALAIHATAFVLAPPYVPRPFQLQARPFLLLTDGAGATVAEAAMQGARPSASARRVPEGVSTVPIRSEQIEPATVERPDRSGAPTGAGGTAGVGGGQAGGGEPLVYYAFDTPPRAVRRVEPEYPLEARNTGGEGTVVVDVNIDERGRIMRAWVVETTAPDALVAATLDAVYQFAFEPALQSGVPVKSTVAIPFKFSLKRQL